MLGGRCWVNKIIALDICEAYDIAEDEWSYVKPMNIKKYYFAATVINNQYIYTFGGHDSIKAFDQIERYDIALDVWKVLDIKLNSPNSECACFCPENDKVVVLGG